MKMTFGKYKGKEVEWVLKNHPSYLRWAVKNVEFFELPEGMKLPPAPRRIIWIEDDDYWEDPFDGFSGFGDEWDW